MGNPKNTIEYWLRKFFNSIPWAKQRIQQIRSQRRFLLNKRKRKSIRTKLLEQYHLKSVRSNPYNLTCG